MRWIQGDKLEEVKIVIVHQTEGGAAGTLQQHCDQQRDPASPRKLETRLGPRGRRLRSTLQAATDCDAGPSLPTEGAALTTTRTGARSRRGAGARQAHTRDPGEGQGHGRPTLETQARGGGTAGPHSRQRQLVKQLMNTLLGRAAGHAEFTSPSPPLSMGRRNAEDRETGRMNKNTRSNYMLSAGDCF